MTEVGVHAADAVVAQGGPPLADDQAGVAVQGLRDPTNGRQIEPLLAGFEPGDRRLRRAQAVSQFRLGDPGAFADRT